MPAPNRDIIVVGASAGGLEPLRLLLVDLPADLPAAVFVVLHVGETSQLTHILDQAGALPVAAAENGGAIERGQVYVAPPGKHLLLHDDHMLLRRGPRENFARPAIDPLFRSAAASFGGRVIGVVLSGALSDGTAGLRAIRRCGGVAVVQDPDDALVPTMPRSALRYADVDRVVPVARMASLLGTLSRQEPGPTPDIPLGIRLEAAIAAQESGDMQMNDMLGKLSRFSCPECHGTLWEIDDGIMLHYRCHVGHAYTADSVLASQTEEIDRLLGTLLRSHQERAALAQRMAEKERAGGRERLANQFEQRAGEYAQDAEVVKSLLRNGEAGNDMITNGSLRSSLLHEEER